MFDGNAKLERLPVFSSLSTLDPFEALRNPVLESISLDFPNLLAIDIVDGTDTPLAASVIEIGENADGELGNVRTFESVIFDNAEAPPVEP